jgi:hypothetical protein
MNKEFVPHDAALAMKELGFDEDCFGFYIKEANNQACGGDYPCNGTNSAPLYQQAFRWFREKYGLDGESTRYNLNNRESKILGVDVKHIYLTMINGVARDWEDIELKDATYYATYEEAELACLRKLIEIVNQNKE